MVQYGSHMREYEFVPVGRLAVSHREGCHDWMMCNLLVFIYIYFVNAYLIIWLCFAVTKLRN